MARQRKTQGPHLCQPFCFLSTIRNAPSLKDHPTGGTYSKCEGKGAPRKQHACKELRIFFVHLWGGQGETSLPLLGFITDCLQGWLCCSWKPCSPRRAVPTPWAAATKEEANTTHIAHVSHHRPIQPQRLPCNGLSPMVWTLQLATHVPTKFINTLNLMYVVIDTVK